MIAILSDEEKKAIEYWKTHMEILHWNTQLASEYYMKILLELIEKQSKEIEELKEKNRQGKMRIVQLENEITARIEDVNKYFTPNDKIKAKIDEYKEKCKNCNFRGKICKEFKQNYNCTIAMCLKEFYSLLEKD